MGASSVDICMRLLEAAHADSREALKRERRVIAANAREYAENYPQGSDGRNTFVLFAEWVESRNTTE